MQHDAFTIDPAQGFAYEDLTALSGTIELDASIMEGTTLRGGAVTCLPPFREPIAIAPESPRNPSRLVTTADAVIHAMKSVHVGVKQIEGKPRVAVTAVLALALVLPYRGAGRQFTEGGIATVTVKSPVNVPPFPSAVLTRERQTEVAASVPDVLIADVEAPERQATHLRALFEWIEQARQQGIAYVGVRNSCHFGAAGYYTWLAAQEGLIGIAMANDIPSVAAPGSRGAITGSNPISYAIPAGRHPAMLLDMSTATVAGGKVYAARMRGETIPNTWLVGADGRPTTIVVHGADISALQAELKETKLELKVRTDIMNVTSIVSVGAVHVAVAVDVLDADQPLALMYLGVQITGHGGDQGADVQRSGGGGREPRNNLLGH